MLIFERALFTTRISFNPSPSKSATCNWLIWLSMGKISGPVNPKVLVLVCARQARHAATAIVVAQKNRLNGIIIETQRKVPSLDRVGEANCGDGGDGADDDGCARAHGWNGRLARSGRRLADRK